MDFIALFKDFGFPALVTGVLLWMYAKKLEELKAANDALKEVIVRMDAKLEEVHADIRSLRENTRTRGARQ